MEALVLAVLVPSVMSVAVTVRVPAVLSVTFKVRDERDEKDIRDGRTALASEEVRATVSVALTGFQLASTALTVTVNNVPAVWAVGVPLLPVLVPGAAVSPGVRICSLANAPAWTWSDGVVAF